MRTLKLLLLLPLALLFGCQHDITPQVITVTCQVMVTAPGKQPELRYSSWQVYSSRLSPKQDTLYATFICAQH